MLAFFKKIFSDASAAIAASSDAAREHRSARSPREENACETRPQVCAGSCASPHINGASIFPAALRDAVERVRAGPIPLRNCLTPRACHQYDGQSIVASRQRKDLECARRLGFARAHVSPGGRAVSSAWILEISPFTNDCSESCDSAPAACCGLMNTTMRCDLHDVIRARVLSDRSAKVNMLAPSLLEQAGIARHPYPKQLANAFVQEHSCDPARRPSGWSSRADAPHWRDAPMLQK